MKRQRADILIGRPNAPSDKVLVDLLEKRIADEKSERLGLVREGEGAHADIAVKLFFITGGTVWGASARTEVLEFIGRSDLFHVLLVCPYEVKDEILQFANNRGTSKQIIEVVQLDKNDFEKAADHIVSCAYRCLDISERATTAGNKPAPGTKKKPKSNFKTVATYLGVITAICAIAGSAFRWGVTVGQNRMQVQAHDKADELSESKAAFQALKAERIILDQALAKAQKDLCDSQMLCDLLCQMNEVNQPHPGQTQRQSDGLKKAIDMAYVAQKVGLIHVVEANERILKIQIIGEDKIMSTNAMELQLSNVP